MDYDKMTCNELTDAINQRIHKMCHRTLVTVYRIVSSLPTVREEEEP